MAQTITYYAIIDEFSSRDRPGGVLRRGADPSGGRTDGIDHPQPPSYRGRLANGSNSQPPNSYLKT
jgi:hypothetical protein